MKKCERRNSREKLTAFEADAALNNSQNQMETQNLEKKNTFYIYFHFYISF